MDFGCTNFATLSTGEKIEGPKPHKAVLNRLARLNRSLHRKVKGSRNRLKAKRKIARLHARIANVRNDFLHKFTTGLVRRFTVIGIEDLNVSGMTKNHRLARSILDQAPFEMRRQLEYKAPMYGATVVLAERFYPSSKTCSACGHKIDTLALGEREWACPTCGVVHDRDINASINLRNNAASSAAEACGAAGADGGSNPDVKPAAMKQEPGTFPEFLFAGMEG